jgi:hypothetical protein
VGRPDAGRDSLWLGDANVLFIAQSEFMQFHTGLNELPFGSGGSDFGQLCLRLDFQPPGRSSSRPS